MTTVNIELKINPENSSLVRKLRPDEYQALKKSIKENGQLVDIIANEKGEIEDGEHRFKACLELGLKPKYVIKKFYGNRLEEKKFVIEMNKRRHLNQFERAELAYKWERIEMEEAKLRQLSTIPKKGQKGFQPIPVMWGPNEPHTDKPKKGRFIDKISEKYGIPSTQLKRSFKIIEHAPEEVKEKIRTGKEEISTIYNRIVQQEKREKRQNEIRLNPSPNNLNNGKYKIIQADIIRDIDRIRKLIPQNSIDIILTDPPYGYEALPLYEYLAQLAEWVLKPGRSLIFIYGHITQIEIIEIFLKHRQQLKPWWPLVLVHNGPHKPIDARGVYAGHKPILWYINGEKPDRISRLNYISDTIQSVRPDKEEDEWKQSPEDVEPSIQGLTIQGETVLDPFCGTGTFGIAALRNNRKFIGIDNNLDKCNNANANLAKQLEEQETKGEGL